MRAVIAIILFLGASASFAKCDSWTPDLKFKIEGSGTLDTLAWIGGWSAAIDAINQDKNTNLRVCTPECGYLISKQIVDILNSKFAGQTVSAETAAAVIWPALQGRLVCPKK